MDVKIKAFSGRTAKRNEMEELVRYYLPKWEYRPDDCPLCLRAIPHSEEAHFEALSCQKEVKKKELPKGEGR